jgi:ribosomal protein S20
MPIIASAKKKMRKDKKLTEHNAVIKANLKNLLKKARRSPSPESLREITSALDKAVKTKFIHANKAARLKSRLSKLTEPVAAVKKATPKKKTPLKKTTSSKKK